MTVLGKVFSSRALAFGALGLAALVLSGGLQALAQDGVTRTILNRADLTRDPSIEVVVSRLEIAPGARIPLHTHHGDEHLVVVDGGEMTAPNGKAIMFTEGMTVHFPEGKVHGGMTNTGSAPVVVYTTHVIEKGKPFQEAAE
ncbi:cupin domain-containing protein [Roseibium sediminis]|uniref:cupin domain-containing protein n=1 Tax=Roseibium sediminis TaxID=1775174 RepID=UPI00123CE685|nr:cupin domain-containing protein [Roseibium sediminis]